MSEQHRGGLFILGLLIAIGLIFLGFTLAGGIVKFKTMDRTVTVKGLSEKEVPADTAIWPIKFMEADNDLNALYAAIQRKNDLVVSFLRKNGFDSSEITVSIPSVDDRLAQGYNTDQRQLRYAGTSVITVYSTNVSQVRETMGRVMELGRDGIAFQAQDYQAKPEFMFTRLNDLKPDMIEEATRNAREVAVKFAKDSDSELGKIKKAQQGVFSITDRDTNTPHIKKIRVVSTVEYYLSD